MPHDANGQLLQVGDEVIIRAKVTSVQPGEDYCNATVETEKPMPPYQAGMSITLNTKQCEKLPTSHRAGEVTPLQLPLDLKVEGEIQG